MTLDLEIKRNMGNCQHRDTPCISQICERSLPLPRETQNFERLPYKSGASLDPFSGEMSVSTALHRNGVSLQRPGLLVRYVLGWILPPLRNSWTINIIWLYLALNRTPNMDCYWGGSAQVLGFLSCIGFLMKDC